MDKVRFFAVVALSGFVNAGLPLGAHAQELDAATTEYVPVDDAVVTAPAKLPDGFYPALSLGANLNLASNSNVVGQVDGLSLLTASVSPGNCTSSRGCMTFAIASRSRRPGPRRPP